jgi:uncharacterized protein (TIRG00374 family)
MTDNLAGQHEPIGTEIDERRLGVGSVEPAQLPSAFSAKGLRRGLIRLGALVVLASILITLLPGLGSLRQRFAHAQPTWIAVACTLELLSALSYVPAFRIVFCSRISWGTSYKIAMAEQGANSLLPIGGAGGLALGAWALRRGGMPGAEIARKTVAFFLLTSLPNVGTLVLVGIGLATGVLPGQADLALTVGPAVVAAAAIAATLELGHLTRRIDAGLTEPSEHSRHARLAAALHATADGIGEAVRLLRRGDRLLLLGLVGYMLFDILVLWASFRALGSAPELPIVWIAYLIGQLGNLIPLPGGIGGVEIGLIGMLVLYGLPAVTATAAVLLYRAIELWIPAAPGAVAFIQLRALLRREADAIDLCRPGDTVEIVGLGPVIVSQPLPPVDTSTGATGPLP